MTEFFEISSGEYCKNLIGGRLLMAIRSIYCQPEVCTRITGKQLKLFDVSVDHRLGCVLSSFFFINCMNGGISSDEPISASRSEEARLPVAF